MKKFIILITLLFISFLANAFEININYGTTNRKVALVSYLGNKLMTFNSRNYRDYQQSMNECEKERIRRIKRGKDYSSECIDTSVQRENHYNRRAIAKCNAQIVTRRGRTLENITTKSRDAYQEVAQRNSCKKARNVCQIRLDKHQLSRDNTNSFCRIEGENQRRPRRTYHDTFTYNTFHHGYCRYDMTDRTGRRIDSFIKELTGDHSPIYLKNQACRQAKQDCIRTVARKQRERKIPHLKCKQVSNRSNY